LKKSNYEKKFRFKIKIDFKVKHNHFKISMRFSLHSFNVHILIQCKFAFDTF
jgi:hypothetical protein